ncbi:MAG: hypothetical protein ACFFFY_05120 [Promethearchaeota archaeon]
MSLERNSNHKSDNIVRKKAWDDLIVVESNEVPGKKIVKTLGSVRIKHDASLGFKKHSKWAFNAPDELKKIAYKLGANAITGVRFAFIGEFQHYYGTAVIVEDEDHSL